MTTEGFPLSIDMLDDYSIIDIFSYLPVLDLINMEKVSDKWKHLSLKAWKSRKHLNIWLDFDDDRLSSLSERDQILLLRKVFERCGSLIINLTLSRQSSKMSTQMLFVMISIYCDNLTFLDITRMDFTKDDLKLFSDSVVQNLKSVDIYDSSVSDQVGHDYDYDYDDSVFSSFLKRAINLEEISISGSNITGSCLLNLTNNWKRLSFRECYPRFSSDYFKEIVEKSPNLEKLDISNTVLNLGVIKKVPDQLHSLDLFGNDISCNLSYNPLMFKNLRSLDIGRTRGFSDDILHIVADTCPLLEVLDVFGCDNISEADFFNVAKLKNLTYLDIFETCITDDALKHIAESCVNLDTVVYGAYYNLTEAGLIHLVTFASALTRLHVDDSLKLTSNFFKSALNSVLKRSNKSSLTIYIRLDSYGFDYKLGEMKRLKLKTIDADCDSYPSEFFRCKIAGMDTYDRLPNFSKEIWYVDWDENENVGK